MACSRWTVRIVIAVRRRSAPARSTWAARATLRGNSRSSYRHDLRLYALATISGGSIQARGILIGDSGGTGLLEISGSATTVTATNGSPAFYSAGLRIGGTVISGTGSVTQSAGLVSIQNSYIMIGDAGVGSYLMTGGTLQQGGSGDLRTLIGWSGAAPTGSLVVSGNAVASLGGDLDMGYNGNATVTVSQSGSLTMAGATNFAQNAGSQGTLNLNGGTLATNGLSVGSGSATVNFNGGMLMAASSFNTSLPMTINAGGAVFNTNGQTLTLSGPLVGTGGLTAVGNGTLVITAGNTYSGGTTISAGTLQIDNGGATGSLTGNIFNNGTLVFDRSDNLTFGGSISGSGSVTQAGGGVLTLSGSNTYSGGTTVNTGRGSLRNSSAVGANSSPSVAYGRPLLISRWPLRH